MTVDSGATVKIRSIVASLAAALLLAPGCQQQEDSASHSPPNPAPRADLPLPAGTKRPGTDQGGATKDISNVEEGLRKDLGGPPLIKPDAVPATAPPAGRPGPP